MSLNGFLPQMKYHTLWKFFKKMKIVGTFFNLPAKVQFFWEGHKNLHNLPHGFEIYLVNIKTMRKIAQIFVAFSEKLNFNISGSLCSITIKKSWNSTVVIITVT